MQFEAKKESFSILSRFTPFGPTFTLLGVQFDTGLSMSTAVTKLHNSAMWKLRTLLRARRFYEVEETITTYKTKILSYLEYRTPAIYHANGTLLLQIDGVQTKLLREMGLSDEDALSKFH